MNEQTRTLIHVGIAAVIAIVVGVELSRTSAPTVDPKLEVLFPDFKDPLAAKSLEIIRFDEKLGIMKDFKVAEVDNRWVIPSENNYPADAQDRLRDAAAALIDLKPVGRGPEVADAHQEFGVVEPVKGKTKAGDQGVGTLVVVQNKKGDDLFKLIVGKEASSEKDNLPGLRFVRKPGEDAIFVAKIEMEKLPTDFDQWIEKDLLKLNALDVQKVTLKDYNVIPASNGRFIPFPRMDATVLWNREQGKWELLDLLRYTQTKEPVSDGLGPQEELNKQKLDDLKTALDDLKIVNVERKPKGVNVDLTINQATVDNKDEVLDSLRALGFYPLGQSEGKIEVGSANGEVLIDMRDGVQYLLRFGNVASDVEGAVEGKLNRYLFVSAQLSPDIATPPTLLEVPAVPAGPAPSSPAPSNPAPANPAPSSEEKKNGGGGDCQPEATEDKKSDDPKAAEPKAAEPKAADPKTDEPKTEVTPPADPVKPGPPPVVDPAQDAVDKIRKENRRRMEEWEDKKKKAAARVAELNARFADWYYVISEDVYKKVHLSRADIIQEGSGAKDEGYGVDAFRELERGGIEQLQPSTPPGGGVRPGGFDPNNFRGFEQ